MRKKYLPIILEKAELVEELLDDFFKEYKIENREYAREVICDELVKSFIEGTLDDLEYFFETKSEIIIEKIFANNVMQRFVSDGLITAITSKNDTKYDVEITKKGEDTMLKLIEKIKMKS